MLRRKYFDYHGRDFPFTPEKQIPGSVRTTPGIVFKFTLTAWLIRFSSACGCLLIEVIDNLRPKVCNVMKGLPERLFIQFRVFLIVLAW